MNESLEHIVAIPGERKHETPVFLQHGAWSSPFGSSPNLRK